MGFLKLVCMGYNGIFTFQSGKFATQINWGWIQLSLGMEEVMHYPCI